MANYIKTLQEENQALKQAMEYMHEVLTEYQVYYSSDKFQGVENNYAHVSTDVYPKLSMLKMYLQGTLSHYEPAKPEEPAPACWH